MKALPLTVLFLATPILKADEFFTSKVEPILKKHCFKCHSHDTGKMKGGLTLDSQSGWAAGGDSGPAIVPGKPDESLLITAIRHTDPDYEMPPKKKLSPALIETLVEWVRRGAPDPREARSAALPDTNWWSLKKLSAPEVPEGGHPIDAFVRQRLSREGLKPSPRADRTTLARRLSIDLHGLLPTPEEVGSFARDEDPQAYLNLVNQLLDSPRYGERWARHWLDVIHFADSHGCEHDVKRPNAWRFRDYVIERLNADVPWGRFIQEQLAADVAFPDEPRLTAGLGFIAAGPLELSRAGTAPLTFDYFDRDDIVTQTMASFVSTTANCARCHTHKFDPVTQEDYFSLQAVFSGIGKGDIEFDSSAKTLKIRHEMEALLAASKTRNARVLLHEKYAEIVRTWISNQQKNPVHWQPLNPEVFVASNGSKLTKQKDLSIFAEGTNTNPENYTITAPLEMKRLSGVRLEVLKDKRLPKGGPGRAGNGNIHLAEVDLQWFARGAGSSVPLKIARASADFDQDGWTSAHAIDNDPKTAWAIYPKVNHSHQIVFELAKPIEAAPEGKLVVTLKHLPPVHLIGRFRLSATDAEGATAQALPAEVIEGLQKPETSRTPAEALAIATVALQTYAHKKLAALPPREVVYGASSSWSHAKKLPTPQKPKPVHLLRRGDINKPVHEVGPGALSAIKSLPGRFKFPESTPETARRAALADWLGHHDNPLTWRSIVNRVWHYHFGRGLCDTPNDFGRMGSEPTHPELLDWLAVWFRDEAKGSLKELHRLILTSATWQQSSRTVGNPKDSDNQLLWRMNRRRVAAEVFRDSILRMAGRLDLTMGGPGIEQFVKRKGPQSTPALDYPAYDWNSPGASRRSIYRVVWRGIPDPFMEAMDFPDLGLLAPKRGSSVSALQSLAMFNGDFVLHASGWLAGKIAEAEGDLDSQVRRAIQLTWLRSPSEDEQLSLANYAEKHGLAALCRVLINSNEFLFVE